MKNHFPASPVFAILFALTAWFVCPDTASAQLNPLKMSAGDLEERIGENRERFEKIQKRKGKAIPPQALKAALGIVILNKVKAGLGIGGEIGNGVAMIRNHQTGQWGPPAFVSMAEGSIGLQIGAEETTTVLLLMSDESLNILRSNASADLSMEIEGAIGPLDLEGDFDSTSLRQPVLVYSDSDGAFAGATFTAGGLAGATEKNETLYGMEIDSILFTGKPRITEAGQKLAGAIDFHSRM